MKAASLNELKQELSSRPQKQLLELCLKLAKFKKENKELLNFLLFESADLQSYIDSIRAEITQQFSLVNKSNLYLAKKSFRKILRYTNKYIKYTSSKQAQVELLIHYCINLKSTGISIRKSTALTNLYNMQLKKIHKEIGLLHEDLQYDYIKQLEAI